MVSEVFLIDGLQGGYVKRDAYYTGYKWHDIDKTIFDRQENTFTLHTAKAHADTFWNGQRPVKLTTKEASIDSMTHQLKQKVWFNVLEFTLKTCLEGYMTLSKNGYFDYGPVMSTYSQTIWKAPAYDWEAVPILHSIPIGFLTDTVLTDLTMKN